MVTPVQHLNQRLGIYITQPSENQSRRNLLPGQPRDADGDLVKCQVPYVH
jgi:hypothetical protein